MFSLEISISLRQSLPPTSAVVTLAIDLREEVEVMSILRDDRVDEEIGRSSVVSTWAIASICLMPALLAVTMARQCF